MEVKTVSDPEGAADEVKNGGYHLIVLDLMMPKLDGIEVLSRIRKVDTDVAVVIFTGYPNLETAVQSMKLDAVDYLKKPFNADEFREVVDRVMRKKGLLRTPEENLHRVIGDTIRNLRKEANLTLKQMARRTGLSVSLLSQIERAESSASISLAVQDRGRARRQDPGPVRRLLSACRWRRQRFRQLASQRLPARAQRALLRAALRFAGRRCALRARARTDRLPPSTGRARWRSPRSAACSPGVSGCSKRSASKIAVARATLPTKQRAARSLDPRLRRARLVHDEPSFERGRRCRALSSALQLERSLALGGGQQLEHRSASAGRAFSSKSCAARFKRSAASGGAPMRYGKVAANTASGSPFESAASSSTR